MVAIFLEDGFEDIEALGTIDILRRAGIEVRSISSKEFVVSKSRVTVKADMVWGDEDVEPYLEQAQCLILPGGIPGVPNLKKQEKVLGAIKAFNEGDKWIAAICAAPTILSEMGLLEGLKATSYPGMDDEIRCAKYKKDAVVVDGRIITSRGAGTTHLFAKEIVTKMLDKKTAEKIIESMVY